MARPVRQSARTGAQGKEIASGGMGRVILLVILAFALAVIGGGLFLAFWDLPVPLTPVEKVLPDARFPK
jgi:cell division septal protein FtsQ